MSRYGPVVRRDVVVVIVVIVVISTCVVDIDGCGGVERDLFCPTAVGHHVPTSWHGT